MNIDWIFEGLYFLCGFHFLFVILRLMADLKSRLIYDTDGHTLVKGTFIYSSKRLIQTAAERNRKEGCAPLPPPGDQQETTVECGSLAWMVDFPGEIVKLSSSLALSGGLLKHRLAPSFMTTWSKLLWYYLIISSSWPECPCMQMKLIKLSQPRR